MEGELAFEACDSFDLHTRAFPSTFVLDRYIFKRILSNVLF